MLLLSVGVVVMSVGVVVIVVGASFAQRHALDPRATFLRVAASSGVMSLGSAAMYVVAYPTTGVLTAHTAADTALILSAGLLCVAVSTVKESRARASVALTSLAGIVVAASSELLTPEVSQVVLLWAMALTCGACAVLAVRNTDLPSRPVRLLAAAMAFYALYCGARAVDFMLLGYPASASSPFGFVASLIAAFGTNVVVTTAIVMLFLPVARAGRRRSRQLTTLTISDWNLVSAAYGPVRARQLVDDLQMAARDRDPFSVDVHRGVATTIAAPIHMLTGPLILEFGWMPEEIALIVADDEPRPTQ